MKMQLYFATSQRTTSSRNGTRMPTRQMKAKSPMVVIITVYPNRARQCSRHRLYARSSGKYNDRTDMVLIERWDRSCSVILLVSVLTESQMEAGVPGRICSTDIVDMMDSL